MNYIIQFLKNMIQLIYLKIENTISINTNNIFYRIPNK